MPRASPDAVPMVATLKLEVTHVALVETFCLLPSLKVPVAMYCRVPPFAMEAVVGVIVIDLIVDEVPARVTAGLTMLPRVAVIWVVPVPRPNARPVCEPMEATAVLVEVQVTLEEMSCLVPSLKVPIAVNCCVPPGASEVVMGATEMDCSVAVVTVRTTAGLTTADFVEPAFKEIGEPEA